MTDEVGDTYNLGSEAKHREVHRQMPMRQFDGSVAKYFPMHALNKGADPAFPDEADHVATVIATDSDGRVTRHCTCGARWSWYPNAPEGVK
jgi:hypothetical protein